VTVPSFLNNYEYNSSNKEETADIPVYKNPDVPIDQRVEDLLSRMTLEEKVGQINMPITGPIRKVAGSEEKGMEQFIMGSLVKGMGPGGGFFAYARGIDEGAEQKAKMINGWQKMAIEKSRLGIPLLFIEEGTHGAMFPGATIYPEGPTIGSCWNTDLVKEIYSQAGHEARIVGTHVLNTIVIEPIRDPRLGRNEEAYTEDPYLSSCIARAIVDGCQGKDLTAPDKAIVSFDSAIQVDPSYGMAMTERHISVTASFNSANTLPVSGMYRGNDIISTMRAHISLKKSN